VMFDVNQGNTQDCPTTGPWQAVAEAAARGHIIEKCPVCSVLGCREKAK